LEDPQEYETFNIEDELLETESNSTVFDYHIDVVVEEDFISFQGFVLLQLIVGFGLVLMMLVVLNRKTKIPTILRYYESDGVNDVKMDTCRYWSDPIENSES